MSTKPHYGDLLHIQGSLPWPQSILPTTCCGLRVRDKMSKDFFPELTIQRSRHVDLILKIEGEKIALHDISQHKKSLVVTNSWMFRSEVFWPFALYLNICNRSVIGVAWRNIGSNSPVFYEIMKLFLSMALFKSKWFAGIHWYLQKKKII